MEILGKKVTLPGMAEHLETEAESYIDKRNLLLKDIEPAVIRKAWFTLSHLLLDEGAHVVDMGCDDGAMTYAMAAMAPKLKFTGLDKAKRQINKAKEQYKLFNLDYKIGDASSDIFDPESIDAIINSYVLHEIYSGSRYNERIVSDTLEKQFKALKKGGVMFIRDFARPPPGEFVLMEMPDTPSAGKELAKLSDADLLVWYAEHARPKQDAGCGGFFLEELPERFPNTRLFRLPYKWAYEFIMRKDERQHWETELPMEYTFFTKREFRKQLRALGARVQYSGPYYDDDIISEKFEGRFRLYKDDGTQLDTPPTCYISVAYKMAERKSLRIEERRPSTTDSGNLKITAMRNEKTGEISDIVSRDIEPNEVIPYRVDEEGRLKVYLHDGIARSIANAVPRGGINIDDRRWSGHMVEPITVDGEAIGSVEEFDVKHSVLFARDYLGLKPDGDSILEQGPNYYPAPDYIDERIHTYYLKVKQAKGTITPKSFIGVEKFQAKGMIRELDAQQILNAITVGMIPNARLELQLLSLFRHLKLQAESWSEKQLNIQAGKISSQIKTAYLLRLMEETDARFAQTKGATGQLRPINSTFVEEGQSRGAMSGLSAQDVDFVVQDGKTINTVVVLPLTKDLKGDVHAGFAVKYTPIPQRHEGNGLTLMAPTFDLPSEITTQKEIKKFIADKFGLLPNMVIKMGESYFSHVGLTPQKIHPYAIAAPPDRFKDPDTLFMPLWQLIIMWKALSRSPHMMTLIARTYKYFPAKTKLDAKIRAKSIAKERFEAMQPEWSIPMSYNSLDTLREHAENKAKQTAEDNMQARLKENKSVAKRAQNKAFHQQTLDAQDQEGINQDTSAPNYASEEVTPEQVEEFEAELEAFMDAIENESGENKPQPEKW